MKMNLLNREKYKAVKRMDHSQMSAFLEDIYKSGYAEGQAKTKGLPVDEVKDVILQIKGIGEKRTAEIIATLDERIEMKYAESK